MATAHVHESSQVRYDKPTGRTITTKIRAFHGREMAPVVKARNETLKLAIQGLGDIEDDAEKQGTVTRIFWDREAEGLPRQPVRGKEAIPKLPGEAGIAGNDLENLDKAA
jgi:hypothetical protein